MKQLWSSLFFAAVGIALAPALHAGTILTYDLSITMNSGPLNGQTGTGTIQYDSSLATTGGGFTWVDPTHGLSIFTVNFNSQTLTMNQVVGYNVTPIVMLNVGNLTMLNPFGVWGSTTSTVAPGYFINAISGQPAGFTYESASYDWAESNSGYQSGYTRQQDVSNQESLGVVTWTLETGSVPEPASVGLIGMGLAALAGWRVRARLG